MIKYYVVSGTLREIILANNPKEACAKAVLRRLSRGNPTTLDSFFCVDPRGFRDLLVAHNEDDVDLVPADILWTHHLLLC